MRSPNTRSAAVARTAAARALAVCVLRIARPNASRGVGVAWGRRLCVVSKPLDPPRNTSGHVRSSYWPEPSRGPYRGRRGGVNPDYPVTTLQRMGYVTDRVPAFAEVLGPPYATKTCPT